MEKEKVKKPFYKRFWFWAGAFIIFGWIVGITSEDDEEVAEKEAKQEQVKQEREDKKASKEKEKADKLAEEEAVEEKEKEEAKKKEDEKKVEKKEKEDAIKSGLKHWEAEEDGTKDFLLEEYRDKGMIGIEPNNDEFSVMNVIVADEFRLLSDEEKEYLVNEMGTSVSNLVGSYFGHLDGNDQSQVHVNFIYPDGESAATQKMTGGWKIK